MRFRRTLQPKRWIVACWDLLMASSTYDTIESVCFRDGTIPVGNKKWYLITARVIII